jgi:hypothetical protein
MSGRTIFLPWDIRINDLFSLSLIWKLKYKNLEDD